jgi:hypothetical protein
MQFKTMAVVGALAMTMVACNPDAPAQTTAWGGRDDLKTVPAVKEVSHQEKKTKRECSRRKNGKCKSYRTVSDGYKKVVDVKAKPALYCVELDDVNGSAKDDDVWYTISMSTYFKASRLSEGDTIKFLPIHGGCW